MHFIYTFLIMFGFWLLLSGKFDLFHLTLGGISCAMVAYFSSDLLFRNRTRKNRLPEVIRFLLYTPWLIREIAVSTLHVAYLALHPRMKDLIDPKIIRFKTRLKSDAARVTFANSITLTPGTITIRMVDDEYFIHAISRKVADGLPGEMEERIRRVFREV
ncbi:Na+/H+ antiporter subunit E [Thermodesulfobacteriota bacterium]